MKKSAKKETKVIHTIKPIYDKNSEILILGSLPSVKSREDQFYYAHPKNRFWKVLSTIYEEKEPQTIEEKKNFLVKNKIALYDVVKSCTIMGSSDSTIKNVKVNNIKKIVQETSIEKIYTTGKTAYNLYNKYLKERVGIEAIYLPSTSPANAGKSYECLVNSYRQIRE